MLSLFIFFEKVSSETNLGEVGTRLIGAAITFFIPQSRPPLTENVFSFFSS